MHEPTFDLAIVGGGPAGMAAALVAGRARLHTVVLNEEAPRNRVTAASHGFLTRDGAHPLEMLAIAKEQLRAYPTVAYRATSVLSAHREGDVLVLRPAEGPAVRARRVVLATGQRDDLDALGLPGLRDAYGTSVFPCPFCDGYEHADARIAVFGGDGVEQFVPLVRMWSDDVHVFTHGRTLAPATRDALVRNGVPVHEAPVVRLDAEGGRLTAVRLPEGAVARDAGFLYDIAGVPAAKLADDLGLRAGTNPRGMRTYDADEFGKTDVPGVYVVGDLRVGFARLLAAASEGARCAERIVHEVAHERWR